MAKKIGFVVLILILMRLLTGSSDSVDRALADGGVIDSSALASVAMGDVVSLAGKWEYYPDRLLTLVDIQSDANTSVTVEVPLSLNDSKQNPKTKDSKYGTYHLVINTGDHGVKYGIYSTFMGYSYNVLVNGERIGGNGVVGENPNAAKAGMKRSAYYFTSKLGKIDIVIQSSNFYYATAGLTGAIFFGREAALNTFEEENVFKHSLITGYLFAFFAAMGAINFFYRGNKMVLYFALSCFSIFVRQLITGESLILYIFPTMKWDNMLGGEFLAYYSGIMFMLLFFNELLPNSIPKILMRLITGISLLFIAMIIVLPPIIFSQTLTYFQIVTFAAIISTVIGIVRFYRRGEDRVKVLLFTAGFSFFALTMVLDILYYSQVLPGLITNGNRTPIGLFMFLLIDTLIVLMHFQNLSDMQRRFSEELEEKVVERTASLQAAMNEANHAKAIAERATKTKDQFLANMSHEIRTPMNAIIGMSDLLLIEELTPRQQAYTNDIKTSSMSLLNIINDILDFSKIEAGKLQLVPIHYNLIGLLDNVTSIIRFGAESKNLEFRVELGEGLPRVVFGDDVRLRQVLINTLGNAVKFTPAGFVKLSVRSLGNSRIQFQIQDTGRGIKESAIASIFTPFEQLELSANRDTVGTGLGLAITHNLVTMMGGEIKIDSVYGEGSTFYVTIPFTLGNEEKVTQTHGAPLEFVSAPDAKVLLVDDNQINLNVGAGLLRLCDIECETVNNGADAIEMAMNKQYDIIFMDHMMPDIDGIQATKIIRGFGGRYRTMPIVALTANAISGAREMFLNSGFNDFLSKPIDKALLNEILMKWLPLEKQIIVEGRSLAPTQVIYSAILRKASKIEELDVQLGLNRVAGMQDVYEKSLRLLSKHIPAANKACGEFLERGDLKAFAIEVHGLKGSLANIGAMLLSDLAMELEELSKSGELQECRYKFPSFFHDAGLMGQQLQQIFISEQGFGQDVRPEGNTYMLPNELMKIRGMLDDFNDVDALEVINNLLLSTYEKEVNKILEELKELTESFAFEEGVALIDRKLDAALKESWI